MAISTVLLAYKEEENLKVLLPQITEVLKALPESYEIIVIDTAKPMDRTKEVCEEYGAKYVNQRYPGFGGALRTGIEEAGCDKFLILDSDGSHDPKYIKSVYKAFVSGADVVIGSRYVKGGHNNDAWTSVAMSRILNFCFRLVLGVRTKDVSTNFRMYDTKQLKAVELTCRNYDVLQEVLFRLKLAKPKLVIREVPISFHKRMFGESKRRLLPFIVGYLKTILRIGGIRIQCFFQTKTPPKARK